jgi:hypothetical protein
MIFEYVLKIRGEEKRGTICASSFQGALKNILTTFGEVDELTIRKR